MARKEVGVMDIRGRSIVPRALSLFLALSFAVPVFAQAQSQDSAVQAPGWNDVGGDSLFGAKSNDAQTSELKPELKPEVKPESAAEVKPQTAAKAANDDTAAATEIKKESPIVKNEAAPDIKTESAKVESIESSTEAQRTIGHESASGKAIAEASSISGTVGKSDAAVLAPASAPRADGTSTSNDEPMVVDSDETAAAGSATGSGATAPGSAASTSSAASSSTTASDTSSTAASPSTAASSSTTASDTSSTAASTSSETTSAATSVDTNSVTTAESAKTTSDTAATATAPALGSAGGAEAGLGLSAGSILAPDGSHMLGAGNDAPKVGEGSLTTADALSSEDLSQLGATVVDISANTVSSANTGEGPLVVDCDENSEVESTVQYENLPTDDGKTKIKTGARFPVVVMSQISSKTSHVGDPIEARLKYDLKIGDRLVAKKGSVVRGHINYSLKARSVMHSLVSPERWYRNSGCLGVEFDEIITDKGEHLPLVACPARTARIVKNKAEGRVLGVNHLGQVAGPWDQQLKYKAVRIGLNAAMAPVGVFSFGAMPVALGLIGAANPSFAFMKPVGTNVRHRRIKGFAWGFLSGIPGSWIIEDTVTKGNEAIIKPGDEFLAEFRQEFNGEPASEAQLMPNAKTKVHGDVRTKKK